jgi:hypothetical protein
VYQTTNSDKVKIPGLYGADVYATGCKTSGGFFKYVLVNKQNDNDYRSWRIGPNGKKTSKSEFFGGSTAYRKYSEPTDTIPKTLVNNGKYSWYVAYKAFLQAKKLGVTGSYKWDGNSTLGWFCYSNQWDLDVGNNRDHSTSGKDDQRRVGGTLQYSYFVRQNGWGVTDKTVSYTTVIKRMPANVEQNKLTADYIRHNGTKIKGFPESGYATKAAGWGPETLNFEKPKELRYEATTADAGRWICAYTVAFPNNLSASAGDSNARDHAKTCDYIKDIDWDLTATTASSVKPANPMSNDFNGDYNTTNNKKASVGEKVYFLSKVEKSKTEAPEVVFERQRQRLIKYPDHRILSNAQCEAIRSGFTWFEENKGCIWTGGSFSETWNSSKTSEYYPDTEQTRSFFGTSAVTVKYAGMRICERYGTNPGKYGETGWSYGSWICVNINEIPYTLTPTVSVSPKAVEAGATVGITRSVNNDSIVTSKSTNWEVRKVTYTPDATVRTNIANVSSTPQDYFGGEYIDSGSKEFDKGTSLMPNISRTIDDLAVGTRVCFTFSVSPYTNSSSNWSHSIDCTTVTKKPKVQILGGDLFVGRAQAGAASPSASISTSTSANPDGVFGSWGEYAIAATGTVTNMASASGNAQGVGSTTTLCQLSLLTFTNRVSNTASCNQAAIGNYRFRSTMPNIASRFPVTSSSPVLINPGGGSVSLFDTVNSTGSRVYTAPNNYSLNIRGGSEIPAGRWLVLNAPNSDVTITEDIRYTNGPLSSISQIPQVVIIARNITISENVRNVDAWLIAPGTVNGAGEVSNGVVRTCNRAYNTVNEQNCRELLTVNGPVIARKLLMLRTHGAGTGSSSAVPAEVFNLRPDAYLWAYGKTAGTGRATTVQITELPPRF